MDAACRRKEEFEACCQAVTMFYDLLLCFIKCVPAENDLTVRSVRGITSPSQSIAELRQNEDNPHSSQGRMYRGRRWKGGQSVLLLGRAQEMLLCLRETGQIRGSVANCSCQ
jgi:hypothetical protein